MRTVTVYQEVEVDVDVDELLTDDLIEVLQKRGYIVCKQSLMTPDQERALHGLYCDYVEGKNTNKSVKAVLDELYMYVPLRSV